MSKLQWAAVVGALGLGVLSQIPLHDHEQMPGHDLVTSHGDKTVVLAVTGMT